MSLSLEAVIVLCFIVLYSRAQDCIRGNSEEGDSLPSFSDPGTSSGNAPRIGLNPIQAIITSYQFHCCGTVAGWAAFVDPGDSNYDGVYSIKFQIWRSTKANRYVKVGENALLSVNLVSDGVLTETLLTNDQLHFQPGDVLGYYLEQNGPRLEDNNGGLRLDQVFNREEVWYATGNSDLQNECMLEVGSTGDLSLSTSLGPIISVSLAITENFNCPHTYTSTLFCPTPTSVLTLTASSTPFNPTFQQSSPLTVSSCTTSIATLTIPPASTHLVVESNIPGSASSRFEHVGITVSVLMLLMLAVLITVIILSCVVKKRSSRQGLTLDSHTCANQQVDMTTNLSTANEELRKYYNPLLDPNPIYEYITTAEDDPDYTSQNPVYEYIPTRAEDDPDYYSVSLRKDATGEGMILNEIYLAKCQPKPGTDSSILTIKNKAYNTLSGKVH